jgi:hypothetical protein
MGRRKRGGSDFDPQGKSDGRNDGTMSDFID